METSWPFMRQGRTPCPCTASKNNIQNTCAKYIRNILLLGLILSEPVPCMDSEEKLMETFSSFVSRLENQSRNACSFGVLGKMR